MDIANTFEQIGNFFAFAFQSISFIEEAIAAGVELLANVISAKAFGYELAIAIGAFVAVLVIRQIFALFTGGNNG